MKSDRRLSGVLHVLLHLAHAGAPVTSESLAKAMNTNPVVLRRALAGLRERGYVRAEKGHGGGWSLTSEAASVTLRDLYTALGSPSLIAMGHRSESPGCRVEAAVNAALGRTFREAEELLLTRLGEVTLADLIEAVHAQSSPIRRGTNCVEGHRHEEVKHG